MIRRLGPYRWARITAWTGAAVAWVVAGMAVATRPPAGSVDQAAPSPPGATATPAVTSTSVTPNMPAMPRSGLVVIRYTPVEPPQPLVITQTVAVARGGGGTRAAAPATTVPSGGS